MLHHAKTVLRHVLRLLFYGAIGAVLAGLVMFVVVMDSRPDLSIWHVTELDEEFTAGSEVETFEEYLALEERLFRQLDEQIVAKLPQDDAHKINRFSKGSMSDPGRWPQNWNRSYELKTAQPRAAVLLLHGMSDSPYSLRNMAESLHDAGAYVLGLRIPGHGTAPSGLTTVRWDDMAEAVKLAMRHVAEQANGQPIYIVGYSNGAALAVHYALDAVANPSMPQVDRLVLLSPEIGVSRVAVFAVWQARLGTLLGLDKLAWNGLLPEYDPYKYGSFAVNAGDVAYRLTVQIQKQLKRLGKENKLGNVPPILAFTSIVDATVLPSALVQNLLDRLPIGGHELVLFELNRVAQMDPLIAWKPGPLEAALQSNPGNTFTLSLLRSKSIGSLEVILETKHPGSDDVVQIDPGLSWPRNVYSLSHVALPFPPDDPLYGGKDRKESPGIHLGDMDLRGERGALLVPASEMMRQRWNPFYSLLEQKTLQFLELQTPAVQP